MYIIVGIEYECDTRAVVETALELSDRGTVSVHTADATISKAVAAAFSRRYCDVTPLREGRYMVETQDGDEIDISLRSDAY